MASKSMHLLRKYQKTVLVVMGVILMVTFTVGGSLAVLSERSRGPQQNPVAVTWTKGAVHEGDLEGLRLRHNAAVRFVGAVIDETMQRGGKPNINGRVVPDMQTLRQMGDIGILTGSSDPELLQLMILNEEGRKMGLVVDQTAVKKFLKDLSDPELRESEWADVMNTVLGEGTRLTAADVMEQLTFELRARRALELNNAGLASLPPGKLWDCFNRLNRRATIEAFPVEVAPLVAGVKGEPTTAEIEQIFQDGRFRDPNPNWHEPGFRKPHRLAFEYFRVDFAPFLEEAKKKVTEEEIKKKYDLDISQGLHKALELPPAEPPKSETPKPGEAKPDETKPDETKPGENKPGENKPGEAKPAEPKPGDAKPAEAKPEEAKPGEAKPAEKKPEEAKPVETKTGDKAGEAKSPECAQETPAKPAETPAPQENPADKPATEKPADAQATDKPTTDKPAPPAPKPEQKFKSLDQVREEIRTQLARPLAQDASTKAVDDLTKAIHAYGNSYRKWIAKKEALKGKVDPKLDPGKFDLAAAAAKHGFASGQIPLTDQFEIAKTELGSKAQIFNRQTFQMIPFADFAYAGEEMPYNVQSASAKDLSADATYYFYRTAEEPAKEVTLAEVKDQVVAAWKQNKAYEQALADAKQIAAKVKPPQTLREVVVDPAKVIAPKPFAWLTADALAFGFGMPKPTEIEGIGTPGREFMQAVFALQPGEAGVAPNQGHSTVYVVRLAALEPKEELLRSQFLESAGSNFEIMMIANSDNQEMLMNWYRELEKSYHVKWQRPPVRNRRQGEDF